MADVSGERCGPLRPWAPALLWAAMIFTLSSIPGSRLPHLRIELSDKIEHAVAYGLLGALCCRALRKTTVLGGGQAIALSAAIGLGYGISDEVHQLSVPLRSFELLDMAADGTGAALGASVAWLVGKRRRAASRSGDGVEGKR